MNIISFFNAKGGTGKTSLCYLSGLYMATRGNRILFVDSDSQKSLTRYLEKTTEKTYTLFDVLIDTIPVNHAIQKAGNYDLIPGSLKLQKLFSGITESKLERLFSNLAYDYILLDCPPALSSIVYSAIYASSLMMIPFLASQADIESTLFTYQEVKEIKKEIDMIGVFNRYKNIQKDNYYLSGLEDFQGITTTFPNLSNLSLFIESKDDMNLKRNSQIKESIEILSGLISSKVVSI